MDQENLSYPKRRLNRVFADTVEPLGLNWRTALYSIPVVVLTIIFVWLFLGTDKAVAKFEFVLATLGAVVVVFLTHFIYNWFAAPSRMQREADAKIEELRGTLDRIKAKQYAVDELSALQSEGIRKIWNSEVSNEAELEALEGISKDWHGRVVSYLEEHFNRADVDHFNRLGVVPIIERGNTYAGTDGKNGNVPAVVENVK